MYEKLFVKQLEKFNILREITSFIRAIHKASVIELIGKKFKIGFRVPEDSRLTFLI